MDGIGQPLEKIIDVSEVCLSVRGFVVAILKDRLKTQSNPCFLKIQIFIFVKNYFFFIFSDRFDVLISKIIFKK